MRPYYETAPTVKCRAYIGLEYCNSNRGSDAIRKAMKQIETELTMEKRKHWLKYSGNDPRRGLYANMCFIECSEKSKILIHRIHP